MTILGIETSTKICALALADENGLIAETRLNIKNIHAKKIHTLLDDLLAASDLDMNALDGIAVSIGPGSFTGLRIGLATAKGLALAGDVPVVAVPTLSALTLKAPVFEGLIAAVLRSRKGEYYYALFERKNGIDEIIENVSLITLDDVKNKIPANAILIGHTEELEPLLNNKSVPAHFSLPDAYSIARIGLVRLKNNEIEPIDKVEPLYHQDFIAGKPKSPVISFNRQES